MLNTLNEPRIIINSIQSEHLETWLESFLIDKHTSGLSERTIQFYRLKLTRWAAWCERQSITRISQITPDELRRYLLELESNGNNAGGRHAYYRAIRTFLYWYEEEAEPEGWKNPIKKVKAPRVPIEPIQPISLTEFGQLLNAAKGAKWPERDAALLLALLDTGARAAEFVAMNLEDMEPITGAILIRKGKGGKPRTVFIGKKTRRAVRAYLKTRTDDSDALWVTRTGTRLAIGGLREILRRRAEDAGIPEHSAHDFRRAFALNMLRNGCDIFTLARLMGHSSIQVLQRYLAQTTADTEAAAARFGVVDKM
jgi:integrase/recombinase XerD